MDESGPSGSFDHDDEPLDLERRLARFRRRVEAEGRPRSAKLIDRAIEDARRNKGE